MVLIKIKIHDDTINLVTFSTNRKYLAAGSEDKTCKIWNVENQFELINTIQGHYTAYNSLAFSAMELIQQLVLLIAHAKFEMQKKDLNSQIQLKDILAVFTLLLFLQNGKYLATGSEDRSCKI